LLFSPAGIASLLAKVFQGYLQQEVFLASITMKELLEAGVHFGHQTKRWNPKMKQYIYGERNGIYIIDLQKTLRLFKEATQFVTDLTAQGKIILFVGTKRQAQDAIAEEARRCNMFFVNQRWLGGLLTNFLTIQKSIKRLKELDATATDGRYEVLPKKEITRLERERTSLEKNLSGIKDMPRLPDAIFVIDSNNEQIAVAEARRLGIPVVAIVDTNCDPDFVDYVIPGNDDALRAIRLFTSKISESAIEGQAAMRDANSAKQASKDQAAGDDQQTEGGVPRERTRVKRNEPSASGEGPVEAASEASATL
jgi:small subunit ribosomal protein S2